MKVLMLVKATKHTEAFAPPTHAAIAAMQAFNEQLQRAGVLLDLGGLAPSSRGARLRYHGRTCTVTGGPFAETKDLVAGFSLLQVKTFAEAIEWARRAPFGVLAHDGEDVEVELRPLFDPQDLDP